MHFKLVVGRDEKVPVVLVGVGLAVGKLQSLNCFNRSTASTNNALLDLHNSS